jgi:hydroxymethylbilane synthase
MLADLSPPSRPLRLGTRSSPLAMAQAAMAKAALIAAHGWADDAVTIVPVLASGDKILDRALADVGGKALWTKELDAWLISGEIDFAVHSMKDVETIRPDALAIVAMLPRADVRDRLLGAPSIAAIPQGSTVGTSAPRRTAQLLRMRPDLKIALFRGNVQTRLAKLERGEVAATLLAAAGLDRLGLHDLGASVATETLLCAPAQGAIGIECLAANADVGGWLAAINHGDTFRCVMAERALLAALKADCHSPVAALAVAEGEGLYLRAEILALDGSEAVQDEARFEATDSAAPARLACALLDKASPALRAIFG